MNAGWWVRLEGDESELRELAMHFDSPSLQVVQDAEGVWLGSSEFAELTDPLGVQRHGRELLAVASGALHVEFGRFAPPSVTAAVLVDSSGAKQHFVHIASSVRLHSDVNARVERSRPDGTVEVIELIAPPPQTSLWTEYAQHDADVEDVLAILGREDVRWHDLFHVFEIIEADVGDRMITDRWVTRTAVRRFTQTANSRKAIRREARHGHDRFDSPKRPLSLTEAHDLVVGLVRRWLAEKVPPARPREVVVEVKPRADEPPTGP